MDRRTGGPQDASKLAATVKPVAEHRFEATMEFLDSFNDVRRIMLNVEAQKVARPAEKETLLRLLVSPRAKDSPKSGEPLISGIFARVISFQKLNMAKRCRRVSAKNQKGACENAEEMVCSQSMAHFSGLTEPGYNAPRSLDCSRPL